MRVESSQLVPGCVLLKEVNGKTNKPIIPKKTVLTDQHITILHKFLAETVDVSATLADGEPFQPELKKEKHEQKKVEQSSTGSFERYYRETVDRYKKLFNNWQNNIAIDTPAVRDSLVPFFEMVDDIGSAVYKLNQYANRKDYVFHHSVAVGILSAFLAKKMGYEKGEWLQIGLAGSLSDCGMARMDEADVMRNRSLTFSELEKIKKHPVYSYRMIEKAPAITSAVKLAVLQHHERLDGSGYPLGLTQEKIHIYPRIIAVCDLYHRMTCGWLYNQKQSPFSTVEKLQKDQVTKLDHQVVQVFIDSFTNSLAGTNVRLSTNQTGVIVFMDKKRPAHPIIRLDGSNELLPLQDHPAVYIDELL
ncbi:HD-GYP domain, c-di-GMP phosphodiesterase class II (or its inactivated variant) [Lentibacillus halodurans]|uniref:HD-GYP domain, c-di-GMP phosphodiesterase class II (Or its inactivated variant) n=1 Tax=Lentibacillus halodurans TaxID=237679 RepID=A0A1I0ZXB1_9BACI|nr:HD-GYP domain-containing protein [Lentibacillus halodurans]SFB29716.1 HD-GYP domain, c-di-GMP phosphodiesterase class II (or its inactivated variant) [Lentibacillus halodurans]